MNDAPAKPIPISHTAKEVLKHARSVGAGTETNWDMPLDNYPCRYVRGRYYTDLPAISVVFDKATLLAKAGGPHWSDRLLRKDEIKSLNERAEAKLLAYRDLLEKEFNRFCPGYLAEIGKEVWNSHGSSHVSHKAEENDNHPFVIDFFWPTKLTRSRQGIESLNILHPKGMGFDEYKEKFRTIGESWVSFHEQHCAEEREKFRSRQR